MLASRFSCMTTPHSKYRGFFTANWLCHALVMLAACCLVAGAAESSPPAVTQFPLPLASYNDAHLTSTLDVLKHRVEVQPLNLWVSLLFLGAVLHTFFTHRFQHWSHAVERAQRARGSVNALPKLLHFLGEVEAVFGIWCVPLLVLLAADVGWTATVDYLNNSVSYQEALFVVVIMAMASTRPILSLAEGALSFFAKLGGGGPGAWWFTILTVGPLLGSLITEPAAMTISALLLAKQFYSRKPSPKFAYATLGLLFVNVSVGGVLTHFAAPPVLMVAGKWGWNTAFMLRHFGWEALVGILAGNAIYFAAFRKEFAQLKLQPVEDVAGAESRKRVPVWITVTHVAFMAWSVLSVHHPVMVVGGFLFFMAFCEATEEHQSEMKLRSPILVGFFLAGLVIHGGLQQWWLGPVLGRLSELPLFLGATALTAFNDNAAITYLAALVPNLSDGMKHAVVAGAVTGGGLTVIANAPNPAGQSILAKFFRDGISPLGLALGALIPTAILALCFVFLR